MRGQEKDIKKLVFSGNIWLLFEDEEHIETPNTGDIFMYLNIDTMKNLPYKGQYYSAGNVGYFKADIYDGRFWKPLLVNEFFEEKENYFSKKNYPIHAYNLCCEILLKFKDEPVYKTYREHYTRYAPVIGIFKGKKTNNKDNKNKIEKV